MYTFPSWSSDGNRIIFWYRRRLGQHSP
ncbi:MAG: PD40 domain-containing protein [Candidatus Competibacteraceae bacterium]|nr:PD40 domain-containing protein [Candidatus Competibacteraceae bacterium]